MNDSLSLLLTRQSTAKLGQPAPISEEINTIIAAGMRVPDHGGLTPWHFTVVQNEGLSRLSEIFVEAAAIETTDQNTLEKTAKMPFRAPLIIVVSTKYRAHDKVPNKEQFLAAGCACHAMQMASVALGYGAMWRSGALCYSETVKSLLKISPENDIVGFLYIGSHAKPQTKKAAKSSENHVSHL